jgi:hypothetical protein
MESSTTSVSIQSHPSALKLQATAAEKSKLCQVAPTGIKLTASALEALNSSYDEQLWEQMEDERITRLQKAARELGFELPRSCYDRERW